MNKFPLSLDEALVFIFIVLVLLVFKYLLHRKIGGLAVVGMILILLHQAIGVFSSYDFPYGIVVSFAGIICILLDRE